MTDGDGPQAAEPRLDHTPLVVVAGFLAAVFVAKKDLQPSNPIVITSERPLYVAFDFIRKPCAALNLFARMHLDLHNSSSAAAYSNSTNNLVSWGIRCLRNSIVKTTRPPFSFRPHLTMRRHDPPAASIRSWLA